MAKEKLTYETMNDKQKAEHDKWMARSENMKNGGKVMGGVGCAAMIIGVLLILFITIPLMLFIL